LSDEATPPGSRLRPLILGGISALVVAIFGTAGNFVYHYFTTATPGLTYTVSLGPSLPTADGFKQICLVNARNAGSKEVSDLVVEIDLKQGKIEQGSWRASEGVTAQEKLSNNIYKIQIPLLNPGEHVSLATMMSSSDANMDPEIALRAVGVTGRRENSSPSNSTDSTLGGAILAGVIALTLLPVLLEVLRNNYALRRVLSGALGNRLPASVDLDQREVLTYILYRCSIDDEAEKIRLIAAPVTYREFADYILARGLRRASGDRHSEILVLKCMILIPTGNMHDASRENIKRALRILAGMTDEQIQELEQRTGAAQGNWRDAVDSLVGEDLSAEPPGVVALN
jgi:hypothetical protein